jgi:lysozyme
MQKRESRDLVGIDVSHHQGLIDWPKVAAANVEFAYVKTSQGTGYVDAQFRRNAAGAKAVGIPVGFYHYANPEKGNTALAEAAHFVETTRGMACDLPYCLDLEGEAAKLSTADLTTWALTFMREVKKQTGKGVILYTGAYFARDELAKAAGEFPLWIAHYGATIPLANNTWDTWAMFQYTSSGKVNGISGNVDMDYMDADYFAAITAKPAPPVKPTPQPPKEVLPSMTKDDANKVIALLSAGYGICMDEASRKEFNRLANELRKASGQPTQ